MRFFCKLMLSVLLAATVARAQTPSNEAAKAEPSAAAPAAAPAAEPAQVPAQAPSAESRPYVDSALTFLKAFSHTNRTGPEGEKAWADLRSVSIDKVPLKVGGKEIVIDAAAGQSNAILVRFAKVSTWREASDVQGVTFEKAQLKLGDEEHTGKGRLKLAEKDGKWIVQAMEVE
ncbi:MAG TPA: hypothetical protein VEP66_03740 [Myxococcales bacterium]|nr:hypothetical protein [Myxococcales bacterium]